MNAWFGWSHEVHAAIIGGAFTVLVFTVQSSLLYSRFEKNRTLELKHKEADVKLSYDKQIAEVNLSHKKEIEEYRRLLEQVSLDETKRKTNMEFLLKSAKDATVAAEELSTTATLLAEQHNLRLRIITFSFQQVVQFMKEVESPRPLRPADSERLKAFQSSLVNMISALDFDKYDPDYVNELEKRYRAVGNAYIELRKYTHGLAESGLLSKQQEAIT